MRGSLKWRYSLKWPNLCKLMPHYSSDKKRKNNGGVVTSGINCSGRLPLPWCCWWGRTGDCWLSWLFPEVAADAPDAEAGMAGNRLFGMDPPSNTAFSFPSSNWPCPWIFGIPLWLNELTLEADGCCWWKWYFGSDDAADIILRPLREMVNLWLSHENKRVDDDTDGAEEDDDDGTATTKLHSVTIGTKMDAPKRNQQIPLLIFLPRILCLLLFACVKFSTFFN